MNRGLFSAVALLLFAEIAADGSALATTITVTSAADNGPGSLRAAIAAAHNSDTINFALSYPVTIILTGGDLLVPINLTIAGPGAANLTVSGNNSSRVFHVGSSNTVTLSGLTIADGLVTAGGVGAGIYLDSATLVLTNCVVRNNQATGGSTSHGAGIYSAQSNLTINGCTFDTNNAAGNGGGVYNVGSILTIDRTTLVENSAVNGGGVFSGSGTVTLMNSFIRGNAATHGGGVANVGALGSASLTLNNCTLISNTVSGANATGSQIYNSRQLATTTALVGSTTLLSDNVTGSYSGGAIFNENGGTTTIGNTIVDASAQEHTMVNVGAGTIISNGFNLAFDSGNGFLNQPTDQINTDPLLDVVTGPRDNGGATFTIALQSTSPAIDKGKRNAIPALAVPADQRGEPRPFNDPNIPNATGGDGSDIGSYEADLRLTNLMRLTSDLQIAFTSIVGKTYQLQSRPNLINGTWTAFGNMAAGNGGVASLTAANAFRPTAQFFRVLQTP